MATEPRIPRQGAERLFLRTPRHATFNYNQNAPTLYRNQPRIPFEFYVDFKLNSIGSAAAFISEYFGSSDLKQFMPLVKTVTMPSFKIQTDPLNQYNRKRISQTKITFDPVKIVFHDVVDGKTLKFWEMYYRYYFMDGNEPGMNDRKELDQDSGVYSNEVRNPQDNTVSRNIYQPRPINSSVAPTSTNGQKSKLQNIVANKLENHNFGFNLFEIQNVRNLINSIDIYQVHGGKFNQVSLVNPRISAFTHDTLDYSESSKTLELSFTIDYEYAYYIIQNLPIGGREVNNTSSMVFFERGDYLELPKEQFSVTTDFVQTNNPALTNDSADLGYIGTNVQEPLETVTGQNDDMAFFSADLIAENSLPTVSDSSSALGGVINITPRQIIPDYNVQPEVTPFESTAEIDSTMYLDMNRIAGNP